MTNNWESQKEELEAELIARVLDPKESYPPMSVEWALRTYRSVLVRAAIKATGGHKKRAADLLGIEYSTLYMMLQHVSLEPELRRKCRRKRRVLELVECSEGHKYPLISYEASCPYCAIHAVLRAHRIPIPRTS